jgi:hypothetical protein
MTTAPMNGSQAGDPPDRIGRPRTSTTSGNGCDSAAQAFQETSTRSICPLTRTRIRYRAQRLVAVSCTLLMSRPRNGDLPTRSANGPKPSSGRRSVSCTTPIFRHAVVRRGSYGRARQLSRLRLGVRPRVAPVSAASAAASSATLRRPALLRVTDGSLCGAPELVHGSQGNLKAPRPPRAQGRLGSAGARGRAAE